MLPYIIEKRFNERRHVDNSSEAGRSDEEAVGIRADNTKITATIGIDRSLEYHLC